MLTVPSAREIREWCDEHEVILEDKSLRDYRWIFDTQYIVGASVLGDVEEMSGSGSSYRIKIRLVGRHDGYGADATVFIEYTNTNGSLQRVSVYTDKDSPQKKIGDWDKVGPWGDGMFTYTRR